MSAQADDAQACGHLPSAGSMYDPMSILYTSGSTGIPKGSIQPHFSYIHWMEASIEMYGFTENMVFGNQSPLLRQLHSGHFPPVALGAKTHLLPWCADLPKAHDRLPERASRQ